MNYYNLFFLASLYQNSHFSHAVALSFLRRDSDNFSNSEMNVVSQIKKGAQIEFVRCLAIIVE